MEELLHTWGFWVVVGTYLLSAIVLTVLKLVYKDRFELAWGWILFPLANWAAFLFVFFFVFVDGIIDSFKND